MLEQWAIQLCDVLEYLHNHTPPVIFRDMKPDNVMVTPEGDIKLIDFGVARLFDPTKRTDTLKMGTAGYAPPEQYAGQGQTTPLSLQLLSQPVSLQGRLEVREGAPAVTLERVNDIPLYVIGGIVSEGINRGFQKAWEDSPLQITSFAVQANQLTVHLEP